MSISPNNDTIQELKDLLSLILESFKYINDAIYEDRYNLDVSITSLVEITEYWYKKNNIKYDIYTDKSNVFVKKENQIAQLRNIKEEKEVGYGNRKHIYPLPLGEFNLVDSSSSIGVQIADIVASSLAFALNNKKDKMMPFVEQIKRKRMCQAQIGYPIAPMSYDALQNALKEDFSNDVNPIDFLIRNI